MYIFNIFKYSIQSLFLQKSRSFLTMLGIIIGVGAVIAIIAVGSSAQALILSQVEAMGSNLIGILPGAADAKGPPAAVFGIEVTTLKHEDALALKKIPHLLSVCSYIKGMSTVSFLNQTKEFDYVGVTEDYIKVEDTSLDYGRFIGKQDVDALSRVVVLGSGVKKDLFGKQNPIGQKIKINQKSFSIIGVMEPRGVVMFENQDQLIFVPLKTAQKLLLGVNHLAFIRAKVDKSDNVSLVQARIARLIRYRHNIKDPSKDDFTIKTTVQAMDILGTVTQALQLFLAAVAAISLIVGGIGIMNIMFVNVNERTQEIGLRKALGASKKDIIIQFLIESAVITLIGGIIGIVLGILIALLASIIVNYFGYDWQFIIEPIAIFYATIMAVSIGLIFGLWPANKASKLNAIDALRYE
ncbi:ABC transporter permease [Patescibacteria group bacterium]|nr:ABC transporter permease [Patescibacteria group bacterium]